MKKWIAMLLCLLMLVSVFAGCSAKQESSEPEQTENTSDESSDEVTTESTDSETTQGE